MELVLTDDTAVDSDKGTSLLRGTCLCLPDWDSRSVCTVSNAGDDPSSIHHAAVDRSRLQDSTDHHDDRRKKNGSLPAKVISHKEDGKRSSDVTQLVHRDDETLGIGIGMTKIFAELVVGTDDTGEDTLIIAKQHERD